MSNYLHQFVYGIYPYIALAIFFLGSLIRFDREQYTWKSDSSQLLHRGSLRLGNLWETTAVPDLRVDAALLASRWLATSSEA